MDQEIIANVKLLFYKQLHDKMNRDTDSQVELKEIQEMVMSDSDEPGNPSSPVASTHAPPHNDAATQTVKEFWKQFNIRHAVDFFVKAWNGITVSSIKHGWKPLLPHLTVDEPAENPQDLMRATLDAVRSVRAPGFNEVDEEEMQELIHNPLRPEQTPEEMIEEDEVEETEEEEQPQQVEKRKEATTHELSVVLGVCEILKEKLEDTPGISDSREQFLGYIQKISTGFQDLYNGKINDRHQALMTRYLKKQRDHDDADFMATLKDAELAVMNDDFRGFGGDDRVTAIVKKKRRPNYQVKLKVTQDTF